MCNNQNTWVLFNASNKKEKKFNTTPKHIFLASFASIFFRIRFYIAIEGRNKRSLSSLLRRFTSNKVVQEICRKLFVAECSVEKWIIISYTVYWKMLKKKRAKRKNNITLKIWPDKNHGKILSWYKKLFFVYL